MDAAQHVAEDVTRDVAEDVMGAAEDGGMKVLIAARVIFQRRNPRPTQASRPLASLGRHVKDEHVMEAAQNVVEGVTGDVPEDVAQDLAFGCFRWL